MEKKTKPKSQKVKPEPKAEDPGSTKSALEKLTDKQRLWVEYYLGRAHWNASEAARLAGYADPGQAGWENKKKQEIQAAISERVALIAMSADEVLIRLAEHARGSFKPFLVEGNEGELWPDLTTQEAQENLHLLKKIKPKRRTGGRDEDRWTEDEIELELHDPQAALVHLGRHHKLFTDKTEQSGTITIKTAAELSDDELADIATE